MNENLNDFIEKKKSYLRKLSEKNFKNLKICLFALSIILFLINEIVESQIKFETSFYARSLIDGRVSFGCLIIGMGSYYL